ncbi:MAG: hypothetical protein ACTHLN_14405 [Tepidisphaeraceae bacterium]
MLKSFRRHVASPALILAAAAASVGFATTAVRADDATTAPAPKKISFSGGFDFSSHFVSFGGDVWGGGYDASPFSPKSVMFAHGTVTANLTDAAAVFVNVWSDLNDNVHSPIGGPIQEIDLNVGATYTLGNFTFGATYAYWQFGGGAEKAIEGSITYADKDTFFTGFSINPSVLAHYRFDTEGDLNEHNACVIQFGINPTYTFFTDSQYPLTVSVPMQAGYFTDPYQGGKGAGFGYLDTGVSATVPLAFIPAEYGAWSASASELFYHTPHSDVPGNAETNFFVTTLSVNVSF